MNRHEPWVHCIPSGQLLPSLHESVHSVPASAPTHVGLTLPVRGFGQSASVRQPSLHITPSRHPGKLIPAHVEHEEVSDELYSQKYSESSGAVESSPPWRLLGAHFSPHVALEEHAPCMRLQMAAAKIANLIREARNGSGIDTTKCERIGVCHPAEERASPLRPKRPAPHPKVTTRSILALRKTQQMWGTPTC